MIDESFFQWMALLHTMDVFFLQAYSNHHAEEVLGQCLGSRRRDVIIATKCGAFGKDGPVVYSDVDIEKVSKFLQRLNRWFFVISPFTAKCESMGPIEILP